MGVYKFEIKDFILNILGLRTSYNHPDMVLEVICNVTYCISNAHKINK
ncbi:hypothetical protein R2R32_02615 [Clostridium perfringens]|nr:hypothetical protein [Clostridium perfringens]